MRFAPAAFLAVIALVPALAGTSSAAAQSQGTESQPKRILGYQDPQTGVFHPLAKEVPDATATPTTGTVELTINITVKSTFPAGTTRTISCEGSLAYTAVTAAGAATTYTEEATRNASGNGTAYTCTINIPYSWVLLSSGTAIETSFTGSYFVTVVNSTLSAGPGVLRLSGGDFVSSKTVPATGSTSKYTVNATI